MPPALTPAIAPTSAPDANPAPAAPAPTSTSVLIQNFAFVPAMVRVKVGDTIIWMQNDSAPHNIKSSDGSFDSQAVLSRGQTFSHTFTKKGTFTYICGIHPSMQGAVIVE
jgi:plastocyanin